MIINENGWGNKTVKPLETDKDKLKKSKLAKLINDVEEDLAELKEEVQNAEQE